MVSGKVMMSNGPSCLVVLQRKNILLCFVIHWGGNCCRFGAVKGSPSMMEDVSEPVSRERKNRGTGFLDEDVSLRREGVTTSRLVVTMIFSGKGSKLNLRFSQNPLH